MADRLHVAPWEVLEADGIWYLRTAGVIKEEMAGKRDAERRAKRRQRRGGGRRP